MFKNSFIPLFTKGSSIAFHMLVTALGESGGSRLNEKALAFIELSVSEVSGSVLAVVLEFTTMLCNLLSVCISITSLDPGN